MIVGASLAGAKAAETLRDGGLRRPRRAVGAEPERPYERPPLSKDYLRGEAGREKVYVHDGGLLRRARHRAARSAEPPSPSTPRRASSRSATASGCGYDRLLLATGAEPRRLTIPGSDLEGIHYLRTLADCDALRERLDAGGRVVVVGAGWIGTEVAASARQLGLEVTVIDPAAVPLERVLGAEVGAIYRDIHRDHGVELLLGTGVAAFEGAAAVRAGPHARRRRSSATSSSSASASSPEPNWRRRPGWRSTTGSSSTSTLRTSAPDVFAAGDVANDLHPLLRRGSA